MIENAESYAGRLELIALDVEPEDPAMACRIRMISDVVAGRKPSTDLGDLPCRRQRLTVMEAGKLEEKSLKCLTIAQRMLPGAEESVVEAQAVALMFLRDEDVLETMRRQTKLAHAMDDDAEYWSKKASDTVLAGIKEDAEKPEKTR